MKQEENRDVTIDDLRRYLLAHSWRVVDHPNRRIQVYELREGDDIESSLLLPTSADLADSWQMVSDAVSILSSIRGTTPDKIVHQISGWDRDVLRVRLFKLAGSERSLPLDVASEMIFDLRQFIGHSAYTEFDPRPSFDKAGGISRDFVHQCRFGHTFAGSFGITVESPVQVENLLPLEGVVPEIPFERRVFERIANGFQTLHKSIKEDSLDPLLHGYKTGLNANMCRALSDAYEAVDGRRIEYDFWWSTALASSYTADWQPFIYEGRAFEFSRAAALELEKAEEISESVIEGRVYALKSETPPGLDEQQQFEHVITMYWDREKGGPVGIRVPLAPDQYIGACDAHKEGRKIRIVGYPEKQGKFWTLTKGRDFTILTK